MAYCGPRGLPLTEFLAWSESDQQNALGWMAHEAKRCPSCGTHPDDWADDPMAWHPHAYECPGCQQGEQLRQSPDVAQAGAGIHVRMVSGAAPNCERCMSRHRG